MNYSEALRTLRFNSKMKQKDVAVKAKISQTYLSQIETGGKVPAHDVITKLCKVYGVPPISFYWLAIGDKDVKKSKLSEFKKIKPLVDDVILQLGQLCVV